MLVKRKKSKRYIKIRRIIIALIALFIAAVVYFESQAIPFQEKYVNVQAEMISNKAISEAVDSVLSDFNYSYDDISKINYGSDGKVASVETNPVNINRIKASLNKAVQEKIERVTDVDLTVHIGVFTNLSLLSNFGPEVTFDFTFMGSFNSEIVSSFESTGINQTVHHIKFVVETKLITFSADYSDGITYTTDYEIAQSVITGELPSTLANLERY